MATNDGGPAFPLPPSLDGESDREIAYATYTSGFGGMTLRDYFAAAALAA